MPYRKITKYLMFLSIIFFVLCIFCNFGNAQFPPRNYILPGQPGSTMLVSPGVSLIVNPNGSIGPNPFFYEYWSNIPFGSIYGGMYGLSGLGLYGGFGGLYGMGLYGGIYGYGSGYGLYGPTSWRTPVADLLAGYGISSYPTGSPYYPYGMYGYGGGYGLYGMYGYGGGIW
jgi:hypothetical protein